MRKVLEPASFVNLLKGLQGHGCQLRNGKKMARFLVETIEYEN
tara:strand:- start:5333 stop:5461 length:129 start_codon:yes stop_codon:yes gene_type:complete